MLDPTIFTNAGLVFILGDEENPQHFIVVALERD